MQVKKFEADSVIDALKQVKSNLGPDAIILSTQETKRSVTGAKKFIVVAAVSETHLKKKQMAETHLADVYKDKVHEQSAVKQKMFIDNVYRGIEKKHEARNRTFTSTPYIDIDDSPLGEKNFVEASPKAQENAAPVSSITRVKQAAQEAFKTSLSSEFFSKPVKKEDVLLEDDVLQAIVKTGTSEKTLSEPIINMIQRLKSCGVATSICDHLIIESKRALGQGVNRRALVDAWFAKWILHQVSVVKNTDRTAVEVFVGPHGSGKTSALVKLATHYVMQEQKSVAIVTSDLNKVGGVEQLRVYSRILNAPVLVVGSSQELEQKIEELHQYDKILVDTPGISLSNIEELDSMRAISQMQPRQGMNVHLVVSALTKENDLGGLLKRFRVSEFEDIIVTNIDQTSQHGILLNIQNKIAKPFHSFGIGSDIVDGFEVASRERVLDLIFKLTKQIGERGNDSRF